MSGDILRILEYFGKDLPPNPKSTGWSPMRCPADDHDDRSPSASVNVQAGKVMCLACGLHEDVVGLIMLWEGLTYGQAKQRAVDLGAASKSKGAKAPKGKGPRGLW